MFIMQEKGKNNTSHKENAFALHIIKRDFIFRNIKMIPTNKYQNPKKVNQKNIKPHFQRLKSLNNN